MPNTPLNPDALRRASDELDADMRNCRCGINGIMQCEYCLGEAEGIVSAYLDAIDPQLFTHEEKLFTHEEVADLPVESVIEDVDGNIFEIIHNGERNRDGTFYREYLMTGDTHSYSIDEIGLPATVLKRAPETPRR